jgi:hypothetical protein
MLPGRRGRKFQVHQSHGWRGQGRTRLRRRKRLEVFALTGFVAEANLADFVIGIEFFPVTGCIRVFGFAHALILASYRQTARYGLKQLCFKLVRVSCRGTLIRLQEESRD